MQAGDSGESDYGTMGTCSQVTSQFFNQDARDGTDFLRNQMHREDNSCASSEAFTNTNPSGSPPGKASWHMSTNSEEQNQTSVNGGCPDTYENMIARMGEIEKTLTAIKETVTKASVRCHMLNVDVVTMFSPEMVDTLNNTVEQCEKCIKAMETLSSEDS